MCEICLALALPTGRLHRALAFRPPDPSGPSGSSGASGAFRFTPVAAECCCVGSLDLCLAVGTKFSLLGFSVVTTVQNSPCMRR